MGENWSRCVMIKGITDEERCGMDIMFVLVTVILVISVVATLLLTKKSDENYSSSTKKNTVNLSLIYVVIIFLAILSLGIYIWLT